MYIPKGVRFLSQLLCGSMLKESPPKLTYCSIIFREQADRWPTSRIRDVGVCAKAVEIQKQVAPQRGTIPGKTPNPHSLLQGRAPHPSRFCEGWETAKANQIRVQRKRTSSDRPSPPNCAAQACPSQKLHFKRKKSRR